MSNSTSSVDSSAIEDSSSNSIFQDNARTPPPPSSNDIANYAFKKMAEDIGKLEERIKHIESYQVPEKKYFETASRVNNSMFYSVLFILLIFIMLQIAVTVLLYVFFAKDPVFIERAKTIATGIGLLGVVEMLVLPIYLHVYIMGKIENLENNYSR